MGSEMCIRDSLTVSVKFCSIDSYHEDVIVGVENFCPSLVGILFLRLGGGRQSRQQRDGDKEKDYADENRTHFRPDRLNEFA